MVNLSWTWWTSGCTDIALGVAVWAAANLIGVAVLYGVRELLANLTPPQEVRHDR